MDRQKWRAIGFGVIACVVVVAFVAIAAAGCGSANASKGPLKLGEADNGKAFLVKVGDTIEVVLPGNPTTGFEWRAALGEEDASRLEQVGDPAYAADSTNESLLGGGGMYTFTFKAVDSGKANLKLVYSRAWESVPADSTFTVTITVE